MSAADVGHSYVGNGGILQQPGGPRHGARFYQLMDTAEIIHSNGIKRDSSEDDIDGERSSRGDRDEDDLYGGDSVGTTNTPGLLAGMGRSPQTTVMRPTAFPSPMSMSPSTSPAPYANSTGQQSPAILKRMKHEYSPRIPTRHYSHDQQHLPSMPSVGFHGVPQHPPAISGGTTLTSTLSSRENPQLVQPFMYDGLSHHESDGDRGQCSSSGDESQIMDSPHGTPNSSNAPQILPISHAQAQARRGSLMGGRMPSPRHHPYGSMGFGSGAPPSTAGNSSMPPPHSQPSGLAHNFFRPAQPQGVGSEYSGSMSGPNNNHSMGVNTGNSNMSHYQGYSRGEGPNDTSRSRRIGDIMGNDVDASSNGTGGTVRRLASDGGAGTSDDDDYKEERY